MTYATNILAQVYGGGTYDSGAYQGSTSSGTSTGSGSGSAAGGILTNTGFDLLLVATVAITIVFVALLVHFWRRPSKKLPTEPSAS
jgi:predicted MFS family arabinose efflux permease